MNIQLEVLNAVGKKYGTVIEVRDNLGAANGYFRSSDNRIVLSLASEDGGILRVAGHELYHYLEKNSPDSANKLKKLVTSKLKTDPGYDYEGRVKWIKENNPGSDADAEITAESMFDVLTNEQEVKRLLREESPSFLEKIKNWLDDFIGFIDDTIQKLKNRKQAGAEIRALEKDKKTLKEIRDLFYKGLEEAKKNMNYSWDKKTLEENIDNQTMSKTKSSRRLSAKQNNVIILSENSELADLIETSEESKYNIIRRYLIEKLGGKTFTLSDGRKAIMDKSDAKELSHKANSKRIAEISEIERIIEEASFIKKETNVEHNKFDEFYYYSKLLSYKGDVFNIILNVGHGKTDGKNHIYALTENKRRTAGRIHGLSGSVDNRIKSDSSDINVSQDSEPVNKYSIKEAEENVTDKAILRENEHLKKMVASLKEEMKLTKGVQVKRADVEKLASRFLEEYQSSVDESGITAGLLKRIESAFKRTCRIRGVRQAEPASLPSPSSARRPPRPKRKAPKRKCAQFPPCAAGIGRTFL